MFHNLRGVSVAETVFVVDVTVSVKVVFDAMVVLDAVEVVVVVEVVELLTRRDVKYYTFILDMNKCIQLKSDECTKLSTHH